jgi:PAS domain S-box-containing protein
MSSKNNTTLENQYAALANGEERFRLLFENTSSLVLFQDVDGIILEANPAFCSFFGQPRAQVLHRPLRELLPPAAREVFTQQLHKAASGHQTEFELLLPGQEGEVRKLQVKKIPLLRDGRVTGIQLIAKDITAITTAQQLIERQARQLGTILESITDAFFALDKAWNLTYINQRAEELLGVCAHESLGRNIWELFPTAEGGIHYQRYLQAIETGETVHFEIEFQRVGLWMEVKAFPSADGLAVYLSDITTRVQAHEQFRMLALVAQSTDNGVVITDAQGRTEWVNKGFSRQTGYTLADMRGQKPGAVLQGADTDPATVQRIRERMKQRGPFSVTILNYKKTGQKLWVSMDITPIYNDAGQLVQFIAIQQNISYRKEIEASQARMMQDLYRQNRDLQQFTYVVSHNLRGPLANALGLATLLAKADPHTVTFGTALSHLRTSMEQVDTVLKDLNEVLSLRDQQNMQPAEAIVLREMCEQVVLDLDDALQECGGEVGLDVEAGLVLQGTRAYVYSIFYNLLSNSIKYRAAERRLRVGISCARQERGGMLISFTDNGSGFDMYKAGSDVFQLYKRFHTNQQGRGVGLFLVKTHVEAMGGKIEVASDGATGTRFLIHLDKH